MTRRFRVVRCGNELHSSARRALFCLLLVVLCPVGMEARGTREAPQNEGPEAGADGAAAEGRDGSPAADRTTAEDQTVELTIAEAVELAVESSTELAVARLSVEKSREAIREAQARRGPSAKLTGSGSVLSNPPEGIRIRKGELGYAPTVQSPLPVAIPDQDIVLVEDTEHTYFSIRTTVSQPLFTWGKLIDAVELARLDRDAKATELEATRVDTETEVRNLYLVGRLAERSVPVLEEVVAAGEQMLEDREHSFDEGVITRQRVLESEANLAGLRYQLEKSRQGLASAREAIAYLTGISFGSIEFVTPFRTELPDMDEQELVAGMLRNDPDHALLRIRREQARRALELSEASRPLLPDLSLSVALEITGQRVPLVAANWSDTWDANLIVSLGTQVDLFDSGKSRAARAQSAIDEQMAATGLRGYTDSAELQVRRGVEDVRTAYFERKHAEATLALAREQRKNARVSFENEVATREEYLGAKLQALLSEAELLAASYSFDAALLRLETLTGARF